MNGCRPKIVFALFVLFCLPTLRDVAADGKKKGFVCISYVISKAPNKAGWREKQFIQIDDQEKVSFVDFPKILEQKIPLNKKFKIRIYWEDHVLKTWSHTLRKRRPGVAIGFRPGRWRKRKMKRNETCGDK